MPRALFALGAAALSLAGSLAATIYLSAEGSTAVERLLVERLRGAGESAALLLAGREVDASLLEGLMRRNQLDAAYVLGRDFLVSADARGRAGRQADLLRVDAAQVERAFRGESVAGGGYSLGELRVGTGYFPLRGDSGQVEAVLVLEAGSAFAGAARAISRGRAGAVGLSVFAALALFAVAWRWSVLERQRRADAERAARGEALRRLAAAAAHEIRNPLATIRGTVELMRERAAESLGEADRGALEDVLGEVDRLRRLTEDLLELSAERPLSFSEVSLPGVLEESARATEAVFPAIRVRVQPGALSPVWADEARLRQVLVNLLRNAAEAQGEGEVVLEAVTLEGWTCMRVRDAGPGIPAEIESRLFEPFVTTKARGTGIGLAVSRRWVERQGGTLAHLPSARGAVMEVRLPPYRAKLCVAT